MKFGIPNFIPHKSRPYSSRSPRGYIYQSNMKATCSLTCTVSLRGTCFLDNTCTAHQNSTKAPPCGVLKNCSNTIFDSDCYKGYQDYYFLFTRILETFCPFSNQFFQSSIRTCRKTCSVRTNKRTKEATDILTNIFDFESNKHS